jgi:hypothetical protein
MFRRITTLALVATTIGLLVVASEASAQLRGGFGGGFGGGGIGIGGRGGYIGVGPGGIGVGVGGGYGRGYGGGYGGGYYPGSYRNGYGYGSPGYYGGSYSNYGYSYPSGGTYYSQGVYASPQVVTPAPSTVIVARPPVPSPAIAADGIKIKLPASADGTVNYELNGTAYTMSPGYSQRFAADRNWTITFDDGTGNRDSRTLSAGSYEFTRTSDGRWDLRKL